jgi:hypothetical protein
MERFYFGQVYLVLWRLPLPEWQNFLEIWEIFCYYFIEYIMYPFSLHLFFFNDHDSQVSSFDRVVDLLCIPFTALELFD